jgi:hypothetical protein
MSVAVAHEASALGRLVDGGLENPEVLFGATQGKHRLNLNPRAAVLFRQSE